MMMLNPNVGPYVVNNLKRNKEKIDVEKVGCFINRQLDQYRLNNNLNKLQQETMMLVYMAKELSLSLSDDNILGIIEEGDDLSKIIVLDVWNDYRSRSKKKEQIEESIRKVVSEVELEGYKSSRWLLIHEMRMGKFIPIPDPKGENNFFKELEEIGVHFYYPDHTLDLDDCAK
jgi:hypothetical protein